MLSLQAVTLCLALCIFSSYGEYTTSSENNLQSINDKWQEYGCKNSPKLDKPFGKMDLCLGTMINQMILRILQNYSPTPLPDHLMIVAGKIGFVDEVRTFIEQYLPQVYADKEKLAHIFYQINEYILQPLVKYLDKFPLDSRASEEQVIVELRREEIASILKQYIKEPLNTIVPVTASSFKENLPIIIGYLNEYAPELTENLDLLTLLLYRIKKDAFHEIHTREITKLPKNENDEIASKKPAVRYDVDINGLDKTALLQFVAQYHPERFGDQAFLDKLVQNFELNVLPTSEPGNNQIRNVLLHFYKKVYPKLAIDAQVDEQFGENFKPDHQNNVELTVEVPDSEAIAPSREEIVAHVKKQVMKSLYPNKTDQIRDEVVGHIYRDVPVTSPVPDMELIPLRRVINEDLSIQPSDDSASSEIDLEIVLSPGTEEFQQGSTSGEQLTIRQTILECIRKSFPHIYANKPLLAEILKQLESNILSETERPSMSLEEEVRNFNNAHVSKITVDQSDTTLKHPKDETIQTEIARETKQPQETVQNIYVVKGHGNGVATESLSNSKPAVINPERKPFEIDITPDTKQSRNSVDTAGKVSLSDIKPHHNAIGDVQVTGYNMRKPYKPRIIQLQENIKVKPINARIPKALADKYKKDYMMIHKEFQEYAQQNKKRYNQLKIEIPKVKHMNVVEKIKPTRNYNQVMTKYFSNRQTEKLASIQFPYEHNFLPLMIRAYGPLYEKEHNGESLTDEERLKMKLLERMFVKNQPFRELYQKKFGPQHSLGIKSMLYNMYKVDLEENDGKLIQIDPLKNIKFSRLVHHPNFDYFDNDIE